MKKLLSILALITISSFSAFAELSVKEPCSNGMVLQQNSSPVVWGHASPGAKVRVTTSWDSATYSATTNQKGVWKINVVTPAASYSAYSITVKGEGTSIKIEDVLIGEVWIAAGQSNMEMPMKDSYGTEHEWETEQRMKSPWAPYTSYNGMQHPVQGYTAKGFIWYQGCRMPFYTVEIAPCASKDGGYNGLSPLLRKAQVEATKLIDNCEIVCTNDLVYDYEIDNIHPCRKQPVGNRLAYIALNHEYGFKRLACLSPEVLKAYFDEDGYLCVEFSNSNSGVNRTTGIKGLEICCADGSIVPVREIKFTGKGVMKIDCTGIEGVKSVRYGWGDFRPGNLKNAEGLPFFPFELTI